MDKYRQAIANFLQTGYSDERLAALQAHIEDGKFSFFSCCCLIGAANADHALQGRVGVDDISITFHYRLARHSTEAVAAENALRSLIRGDWLIFCVFRGVTDWRARRVLLPLVLAEVARREQAWIKAQETVVVGIHA